MGGRRRILTGIIPSCPAGETRSVSWGPFSVALEIRHYYVNGLAGSVSDPGFGLFVAGDASLATGAIAAPWTPPDGWTELTELGANNDPAPHTNTSAARYLPLSQLAGEYFAHQDLGILVTGAPFYIKHAWRNQGGGNGFQRITLIVEEAPDADPTQAVVPRPIPGAAPPPTAPPTAPAPPPAPPAPAPAPTPAPPAPVPPAPSPGGTLPPVAMPPIDIDPRDPLESARQLCR